MAFSRLAAACRILGMPDTARLVSVSPLVVLHAAVRPSSQWQEAVCCSVQGVEPSVCMQCLWYAEAI